MWHHSLLLMNSFNKTEAAVFLCRLCFLRDFPFIILIFLIDCKQFSIYFITRPVLLPNMPVFTSTSGVLADLPPTRLTAFSQESTVRVQSHFNVCIGYAHYRKLSTSQEKIYAHVSSVTARNIDDRLVTNV